MKLLAIAYPELPDYDFQWIENFRKNNDRMFHVVRPHFTLVFPLDDLSIPEFANEIKKQAEGIKFISFSLRSSIINKDAFNDYYHAFLIPREGADEITRLHDKLYSGKLSRYHRADIAYIPHITVGNSTDKMSCQKMTDEWNGNDFLIHGIISTVDIVKFENEQVTTIDKIKMKGY